MKGDLAVPIRGCAICFAASPQEGTSLQACILSGFLSGAINLHLGFFSNVMASMCDTHREAAEMGLVATAERLKLDAAELMQALATHGQWVSRVSH